MGACGFVTPVDRKKQEIIQLVSELEEMGEVPDFCRLVLDHDILEYHGKNQKLEVLLKEFLERLERS